MLCKWLLGQQIIWGCLLKLILTSVLEIQITVVSPHEKCVHSTNCVICQEPAGHFGWALEISWGDRRRTTIKPGFLQTWHEQFKLSFIRSESLPSYSLRDLQVLFFSPDFKQLSFIFAEEKLQSGYSAIKHRSMECCSHSCPFGSFYHLTAGTLEFSQRTQWVLGHLSFQSTFPWSCSPPDLCPNTFLPLSSAGSSSHLMFGFCSNMHCHRWDLFI